MEGRSDATSPGGEQEGSLMRRMMRRAETLALIAGLFVCGTVRANEHLRVPEDVVPVFYTSVLVDVLHNEEWAAIPFFRPPQCVPRDFNLLDYFDAAAV